VSHVVSFKVGRLAESKFFYHEEAHSGDMSTANVMLMNSSFLLIASAPRTLPPTSNLTRTMHLIKLASEPDKVGDPVPLQ
jgi:hypothetical protein